MSGSSFWNQLIERPDSLIGEVASSGGDGKAGPLARLEISFTKLTDAARADFLSVVPVDSAVDADAFLKISRFLPKKVIENIEFGYVPKNTQN